MSKSGDRHGEGVVIRRGFVQSRYEAEFAVAAYGIVAPTISWEPAADLRNAGLLEEAKFGSMRLVRRGA